MITKIIKFGTLLMIAVIVFLGANALAQTPAPSNSASASLASASPAPTLTVSQLLSAGFKEPKLVAPQKGRMPRQSIIFELKKL